MYSRFFNYRSVACAAKVVAATAAVAVVVVAEAYDRDIIGASKSPAEKDVSKAISRIRRSASY